jgi:pimeloyl-ACP methyl ester carboxylesterase
MDRALYLTCPEVRMSTFVLVPGGWHGGWYFQGLAEALRARGHRAYAVTLTGVGERQHLLRADVNLDTHIGDVVQLLQMEKLSEVILLGHSYAGMVLSGVIDQVPDRVGAAVYCDAYVPEDGQSCFELANDKYRALFLEAATSDGFSVAPPPRLDARATAHPLAAFLQRLRLRNPPPQIRRGYIYLSGCRTRPSRPSTSVFEQRRSGRPSTYPSDITSSQMLSMNCWKFRFSLLET